MRVATFEIDPTALKELSSLQRKQLFGCMHAHNELTCLNRLLLFSMSDFADDPLHDQGKDAQMWCLTQLLAGKLFETWDMLLDRKIVPSIQLSANHDTIQTWLTKYFGPNRSSIKSNPIQFIRNKTAFHYENIDMDQDGIISAMLDRVPGRPLAGPHTKREIVGALAPEKIMLPTWISMGSSDRSDA